MDTLRFDLSQDLKPFKMLSGTNGGPWHRRDAVTQLRSNFKYYKAARFPYSRNHDSRWCWPYTHDISEIFPNFDADENDPASYDFACTDENILCAWEAGTKTFFRLGQSLEIEVKKHHILPPKDPLKWAKICEHIIRHYNEGWADGHHYNMDYWEIWCEADITDEPDRKSSMWSGTDEQYYDLYEITSKHLKACFPNVKVGGPSLAWKEDWAEAFLAEMQKRQAPMDFFSWHAYVKTPEIMFKKAERIKALMVKYGYGDAESVLDEWNYVRGWKEEFQYTIDCIHGAKGASFAMACMSEGQRVDTVDSMLYYDTRRSPFCGVFDFYKYAPLKGYYPFMWYGDLYYDMEGCVPCQDKVDNIYSLCGVDKDGKVLALITYFSDPDEVPDRQVRVDFGRPGKYEITLVDEDHEAENMGITEKLEFTMKPQTVIRIREI